MGFLDEKEKEDKENINGAECERKQGNDEGRHCKKIVLGAESVNQICPLDNSCNAWAENVQDLYYDRT